MQIMHFGYNKRITYTMGNKDLQAVEEEKYFGVIIQENYKFKNKLLQGHCTYTTTNKMLDMIWRLFLNREEK